MTEEQRAEIAKLKGEPEFKELIADLIPDTAGLKSALEKEREARKQLEREASAKAAEIEKIKAAELTEQGKFKELYEQAISEREAKEKELLEQQKKLDEMSKYEHRYKEIEQSRKDEILEQIPESKREAYKDFELSILEVVVKDIVNKSITSIGTGGAQPSGVTEGNKWGDLTPEQQDELYKLNKPLADKLINEEIKTKYKV